MKAFFLTGTLVDTLKAYGIQINGSLSWKTLVEAIGTNSYHHSAAASEVFFKASYLKDLGLFVAANSESSMRVSDNMQPSREELARLSSLFNFNMSESVGYSTLNSVVTSDGVLLLYVDESCAKEPGSLMERIITAMGDNNSIPSILESEIWEKYCKSVKTL